MIMVDLLMLICHVNGRQVLLHWGYELAESELWWFIFFVHIKMSYYWFNRKELLQKAKDRYDNGGGKEKAAEYYLKNRGWGWGGKGKTKK